MVSSNIISGALRREIQLVVCGAGPAKDVETMVDRMLAKGWAVQIIVTPSALEENLVNASRLECKTGRPILSKYGPPTVRRIPVADGIIVAPATVNTINKLALDIRDNFATSIIGTAVASRTPVVILPSVKLWDTTRPAFQANVARLRKEGVDVLLFGKEGITPTNASSKDGPLPPFPWHLGVAAMERRLAVRSQSVHANFKALR